MTAQRLSLTFLIFVLLLAAGWRGALASADMGCSPAIRALGSYMNCTVLGVLDPSNDTRDNMIFLVVDRQKQLLKSWPQSEEERVIYYGESTVCVSDTKGSNDFVAAVELDSGIPVEEKRSLQLARQALKCENNASAPTTFLPTVSSAPAKDFATYLDAVTQFYGGNRSDASKFITLSASSVQPWVKEASLYMVARVALLNAQASAFDEYGTFNPQGVNVQQVDAAKAALQNYITAYPQGAYAASAQGLLRRAAWVGGDKSQLVADYSRMISGMTIDIKAIDIADEIDHKISGDDHLLPTADPVLVATYLLQLMRPKLDDNGKRLPGMTAAFLEAQRSRFAAQEELFDYLLALRAWKVDADAATVLKLIPARPPTSDLSYLEFSRHILRAKVLAASRNKEARDILIALLPHATQVFQRVTLELELAKYDERSKNVSAVFDGKSEIRDPDIRSTLLEQVAGPIILRQQATDPNAPQEERDIALFRLLARDLAHGRFQGFAEDIKLLPPLPVKTGEETPDDRFFIFRPQASDTGYSCPDYIAIAAVLAKNPSDVKGRLCLGDFFRAHSYWLFLEPVGKDELGGTGTLFAGKLLDRQSFYRDIMKDRKASRDDRAYALYRAVNCYAPIGNNDCGGEAVDKAQRRKWFRELKADYADTEWAQKLDIYW
jgi:hypothetical protein